MTGQRTGKILRTASSLQGWRGKYIANWELLMTCCRSQVDSAAFGDALHLHPTVQAVAEYNVAKLCNTGEPIATIKLSDIMFNPPFAYQRVASLAKSMRLTQRKVEDARLCSIECTTFPS